MGLFVGKLPVTSVYIGSTPVAAVYVGSEKVWPIKRSVTILYEYGMLPQGAYIEGDTSLVASINGDGATFVVDVYADRNMYRRGMPDGKFIPAGVRAESLEYYGTEYVTFTEA